MSIIDTAALSKLRENLSPSASVNLPGNLEYSIKRWAGNAEKSAAVVACPATPNDVAQILSFLQGKSPYESQQKLDVAVKVRDKSLPDRLNLKLGISCVGRRA